MSEILMVAETVYETVDDLQESHFHSSEAGLVTQEEEPWGTELMNYVLANQYVIVKCPWMGGSEVTLGEAMTSYSYPPNMSEKDVPAVMAVVRGLLANRAEDKPEEDETAPEADNADTEKEPADEAAKAEQADQKPAQTGQIEKPGPKAEDANKLTQLKAEPAKAAGQLQPREADILDSVEPVAAVSEEAARPQPAEAKPGTAAAGEPAERALSSNAEKASQPNPGFAERPVDNNRALADEETFQPSLVLEISQPEPDIPLQTENLPEPAYLDIEQDRPETISLPSVIESLDETIDLSRQMEELKLSAVGPDNEMSMGEFESSLVSPDIVASGEDQAYNEAPPAAQPELEIQGIEGVLTRLEERIGTSEPEVAAAAGKTLDKIHQLVLEAGERNTDGSISQFEAEEDLKELFTKLFEQLGIEYTPELVESLARFTILRHSLNTKRIDRADEELISSPAQSGTHEIVRRLLSSARSVKKILENAYAIGKSAIQLCTYDFPAELRKRLAA